MRPRKRLIALYVSPDCRPGDTLVCRIAGEQVVEGFAGGPVPWPFFYRPKGCPRLFVCGDLERALAIETGVKVGALFGVSDSTADRWRRELGIAAPPHRSGRRKLSDAQVEEIRARAAAGEGLRALGRQYGVTGQYVWMLARQPGKNRPRSTG